MDMTHEVGFSTGGTGKSEAKQCSEHISDTGSLFRLFKLIKDLEEVELSIISQGAHD